MDFEEENDWLVLLCKDCCILSHVQGGVQLFGQLQDFNLKAVLDVHENSLVCASILVLLLINSDEVDGKSLGAETACSANSVKISVSLGREICI